MQDTVRRVWMPFLFTDPALISAIVLMAVVHKLSCAGSTSPSVDVLRLRGFVIGAINQALADPQRSCSDQLIVGVANMAIYEAVFGSRDYYHIHMEGLMRILRLRGGVSNLGLNGYLQLVLLWNDNNCANLLGCEPYISKAKSLMLPEGLPPDSENFTVGLSGKKRYSS